MVVPGFEGFTYDYLKTLIQAMKTNFEIVLFSEAEQSFKLYSRNILFLRHDVDISLRKALHIAEIEHDAGVRATYFVTADGPVYSLDSRDEVTVARRILDLGHEIGLHHVGGTMENKGNARAAARAEIRSAKDRLERQVGITVRSISFHRPAKSAINGPMRIEGLINAYAKRLMRSYVSDSAGIWSRGDPLPRVLAGQDQVLQVLIHPIWWGNKHMDPADRLQEFFEKRTCGLPPAGAEAFDRRLLNALGRVRRSGYECLIEM